MVKVGDVVDYVHNEHMEFESASFTRGEDTVTRKVRKDTGVPDLHVPMIVCAVTHSREIGPDGNAVTVDIADGYVFLPTTPKYVTGVRPGQPGEAGKYHERD